MSLATRQIASPPRPVPLSLRAAAMSGFKVTAGTIFVAAGMTLVSYMGVPLTWRDLAFSFVGPVVSTRATLLAAEPTRFAFTRSSSRFVGSTEVTRYRYRFKDASGTLRDGRSYRIGEAVTRDGPDGREIDIEYASSWPSLNRVAGGALSPVPLVFNTIDIPIALAFLLLFRGVRAGFRRVRLLRCGTVALGRVVSRRVNNSDRPLKPSEQVNAVDIEVAFTADGGQAVTLTERIVDRANEAGDQPEEPVLYDPANPHTAMLLDVCPGEPTPGADGQWQSPGPRGLIVVGLLLLVHASWIYTAYVLLANER